LDEIIGMLAALSQMSHAPNIRKHSCRFRRGLLAAALALQFFLAGRGFALDPARDILQYNCQIWSRQNGLPASSINAIAQTSDGYLWFGTAAGLLRFDGIEFKPLDLHSVASVRNSVVTSLAAARAGGLWVGLENSAYGFCDGRSFSFRGGTNAETAKLNVRSILEGRDGTLWLAADDEAARLNRAGKLETVLNSDAATNVFLKFLCGYEDRQGRLWFGTANQGVYCWQDGKTTKIADPKLDETLVLCIAEDLAGQIWVGTSDGLCCYDAGLQRRKIPLLAEEVRALLVDRQGVLWIGTSGRGLARYQHGKYEFLQKADGLGNDYVRAIAEDREGSLWVGTRDGISQLSDVKFPVLHAAKDTTVKDALSVGASSRGGVWIGSSVGVTRFDPETKTYATQSGLSDAYARRVFEARNGTLYVVINYRTLTVFSDGKAVAQYDAPDMIVGMAEDAQSVVVSVAGELYRAGTNYFLPCRFNQDEKPPFYWILNLASGKDGVIWVACDNGIFRVKDGACQHWLAEGLSDTRVMWVCEDQDGVVWAGLLSGIVRLKNNQARLISRKDGLFDDNIYSIVPDDLGNLWVDSEHGIFRVTRQGMNDLADGKTGRVDCAVFDGINSVKVADKTVQEHVGCKTADGRIWFPCPLGVVMIDPAHIPVNRVAPPVHLDRIRANGKEVDPSGPVSVPPGHGELEFHYDATSFIAPQQIKFRYRLEGYDGRWVDADSRRLAFYTNLKPGRYTFRVLAANADGIWNETGASLEIELRPHFYQTTWFYSVCGLTAFSALLGGYLWRIRRLEARQRALQQSRDQLEKEVRLRTAELAREKQRLQFIFESMPVGVALTRRYPDGRIERIINDAHLRICGLTREQDQIPGIYRKITHPEDAAREDELARKLNDDRDAQLTMEKRYVRLDGRVVWVAFSLQHHHSADGSIEELTTVVDITKRKLAETERERLVIELQSALARVKSLSGLLPICSGCKKIRDDKGYWSQVESYIQIHSEAKFSHGLCPDCTKKYFPDFVEENNPGDSPKGAA
jgi:PAS domain S-box-containing protein